jgi:hypothetical protein
LAYAGFVSKNWQRCFWCVMLRNWIPGHGPLLGKAAESNRRGIVKNQMPDKTPRRAEMIVTQKMRRTRRWL